jgi:hypothetical protein
MRPSKVPFVIFLSLFLACAAPTAEEGSESQKQNWDSADGNPTHPTHSILAEYAISKVKGELPEVATYEKDIIAGVNLELHDLKHAKFEALRLEIGGNNWAADHPELLWEKAQQSYGDGDKAKAFFYVGILLHYVQDMGVPAHAFHVIHQSGPTSWDHLELLAFFQFHADLKAPGPTDPKLPSPLDYIEWSAQTARDHFKASYPGVTYTRKFFPQTYVGMTDTDSKFLRDREAHCANATAFALRVAAKALTTIDSEESDDELSSDP